MDLKTRQMDSIEAETNPHDHADEDSKAEVAVTAHRRLKITGKDLKDHGYSPNCHRCEVHQLGQHSTAQYLRHSEACRTRIYEALRLAGSPRIVNADERPRDQLKRTPNEPDPTRIEERVPRDIQTQNYGEADGDLEMTDDLDIGQTAEVIVRRLPRHRSGCLLRDLD